MTSQVQTTQGNRTPLDFASILPKRLLDAYTTLPVESWLFAIFCYIYYPRRVSFTLLAPLIIRKFFTDELSNAQYEPCIDKNNNFSPELLNFLKRLTVCEEFDQSPPKMSFFDAMLAKARGIALTGDEIIEDAAVFIKAFRLSSDIIPLFKVLMLNRVTRSGWIDFPDHLAPKPRREIKLPDDVIDMPHIPKGSKDATIQAFLRRSPRIGNVADHSIKTAIIAYLLSDSDYAGAAFLFGLCHDWAEIITGDATPRDNIDKETKRANECAAYQQIVDYLDLFEIQRCPIKHAFPVYCQMLDIDDVVEFSTVHTLLHAIFPSNVGTVLAAHTAHLADKLDMLIQACTYEANDDMDFSEIIESAHIQIEESFKTLSELRRQAEEVRNSWQ